MLNVPSITHAIYCIVPDATYILNILKHVKFYPFHPQKEFYRYYITLSS